MDVCEPRPRHRGFFLHSSEGGEPDTGEHENPEGLVVRVRFTSSQGSRKMGRGIRAVGGSRLWSGRQGRTEPSSREGLPAIRSGSVTGSRQRAHLPR
jgi:hypothetical protein